MDLLVKTELAGGRGGGGALHSAVVQLCWELLNVARGVLSVVG